MTPMWALNLKQFVTGTTVGAKHCMDVNVLNTVAVPVAPTQYAFKEHRFHDVSSTNINASGGAFIQIETAANVANTITELRANWNGGAPIVISKGADATAAATASNFLAVLGSGQTIAIGAALVSGDKIWVRAVKNTAITTGELMINLLG